MITSATVGYNIPLTFERNDRGTHFIVEESKDMLVVPPSISIANKYKTSAYRLTLKVRLFLWSASIFFSTMVSTLFVVSLERGNVRISIVWIMLILLAASCAYAAAFGNTESKA